MFSVDSCMFGHVVYDTRKSYNLRGKFRLIWLKLKGLDIEFTPLCFIGSYKSEHVMTIALERQKWLSNENQLIHQSFGSCVYSHWIYEFLIYSLFI